MLSNALAMLFGFGILIAMMGWGLALNHLPCFRKRADFGLQACWGVALSVAYGGLLEITRTTSAFTVLVFLAAGFAFGAYHIGRKFRLIATIPFIWGLGLATLYTLAILKRLSDWTNFYVTVSFIAAILLYLVLYLRNKGNLRRLKKINFTLVYHILLGIVLFIVLYRYAGFVATNHYNLHDDYQGYFVFSKRMLQSGTIGIDPFNSRRLENGLGGQYFLNAFPLAAGLDIQSLNLFEPGVAFLVLVALVVFAPVNHKRFAFANLMLVLFFIFRNPPIVNISALLTGTLLLVGLYRTLAWHGLRFNTPLGNALLLALLGSAAICVKTSFLVPVVFIIGISYSILFVTSRPRRLVALEFALFCALTLLFLAPWMLSSYISGGTLFFPFLGLGSHGIRYRYWTQAPEVNYDDLSARISDLLRTNRSLIPFLIVIVIFTLTYLLDTRRKVRDRVPVLSSVVAGVLSVILISHRTGYGTAASRYIYPILIFLLTTLGLAIAAIGRKSILGGQDNFRMVTPIALFLSLGFLNGMNYPDWLTQQDSVLYQIFWRENNKIRWEERWRTMSNDQIKFLKMQKAAPKGATILARLDRPYLMNFLRNPIDVVDFPGAASPPPGLPLFEGSEALAQYLQGQSIRYVAYSYGNEAAFPKRDYTFRLFDTRSPWEQRNTENAFDFQDNLEDLGKTRKRIYDDGTMFLIDLQSPTSVAPTRLKTKSQLVFDKKAPFVLEQDTNILTGPFRITHLRINVDKRNVKLTINGQCIKKTPDEFKLFVHLRNHGSIFYAYLTGDQDSNFKATLGENFEAQASATLDFPLGRGDLQAIGFGILERKTNNRQALDTVEPKEHVTQLESGYILWDLD